MNLLTDTSDWAVRPDTLGSIQRLARADVPSSDLRRLLDDPAAADPEARVRHLDVDAEDLQRVGSVAIISLSGIIQPSASLLSMLLFGGGGGLQRFRAEIRAAMDDDSVSAILLHVDSPGGRCALVEETAAELRAARDRKPIVAVANTVACSAAYWIAAQATELIVTPSGYVGSIGVYRLHMDWSGFNQEMGILPTYVFAAPFKIEGNPDEPLSDAAREDWQSDVDAIHERFLADVALGRGTDVENVRQNFGQGRALTAAKALAAGMVNRVATFEDALQSLIERTTTTVPGSGAGASRAERLAAGEAVEGATVNDVNEARVILGLEPIDDETIAERQAEIEQEITAAAAAARATDAPPADDEPDDPPGDGDEDRASLADDFDVLAA